MENRFLGLRFRRLFIVLLIVSLVGNAYLVWLWQVERLNYQVLLAGSGQMIELSQAHNRRLAVQNKGLSQTVETKDLELAAKLAEIAKTQAELTLVNKNLTERQKELEDKKKELAAAESQINSQKSQLEANSSELTKLRNRPPLFSFQNKSSTLADIETKQAAVKRIVTAAYDTIEEIYGKPYLLHSVTITFVDAFSSAKAAGEIIITNSAQGLKIDIRLKDFNENSFADVNTIIHEIIHSFHGLAVLEPTAFEEGITVAATDAVMKKMIAAGTIANFPSLYIRLTDVEYADYQQSLSIPRDSDALYASDQVVEMYQVLGKAWYLLYQADSRFFVKFNESIYAKKQAGTEITEALVLSTVKEIAPSVSLTGAAWNLK